MKIALVIERMDTAGGGREASTAEMACELVRRGHDVSIICQRAASEPDGVNVVALGRRGATRTSALKNLAADVQREIDGRRYDVVHATLPVVGANVYQPRGGKVPGQIAAGVRRRGRVGGFLSSLGGSFNRCRRLMGRLERQIVGDEKVVCLAVSAMVAAELADFYGRTEGVRIVYNGVADPPADEEKRADWRQKMRYTLGVERDNPVFITAAKNFPLKGVNEAIIAFAKWMDRTRFRHNARLLVVGREHVEGYRRIASLRQVGRQVVFLPPTDDIYAYYAAADACVLLSWYDPCSRVVLEATRWGIPSITTTYNGASEILSDGAGIVVASPADREAVIAAYDDMADAVRRSERAELCRRKSQQLSIGRHVDELLGVYETLCEV
jgi:UDP-glucose:(heptosyl)LPS alpha-1,3-glucosyltransferase